MGDWREAIPVETRLAYERAGYGARVTLGGRPALLIVDATLAFVGPTGMSVEEATRIHPGACGPAAWKAVAQIGQLLASARGREVPVVYTTGAPPDWVSWTGRLKHQGVSREPSPDGQRIVHPIQPMVGDVVLGKLRPSAFHGTPLVSLLVARHVDTVLITGGTTSGCVRATAVDAFSYGFATVVVDDAVFDRSPLSHAVALFELGQKYAEVVTTARALDIISPSVPAAGGS